jgi:hypothetical protein
MGKSSYVRGGTSLFVMAGGQTGMMDTSTGKLAIPSTLGLVAANAAVVLEGAVFDELMFAENETIL